MVVSISDLGSWLFVRAVSKFISNFNMWEMFICGAGGLEVSGGEDIPAATAE